MRIETKKATKYKDSVVRKNKLTGWSERYFFFAGQSGFCGVCYRAGLRQPLPPPLQNLPAVQNSPLGEAHFRGRHQNR
jgi:hypothetical protein